MAIERVNKKMPWRQFRVGSPSTDPKRYELTCMPFSIVSHVAHLETAYRIITDGRVRAGLIFDESKLKEERILVSWLSPNFWVEGFRYGSISFDFGWSSLAEGHRYYWVESIAYGVPACRILLTKNDYSDHPVLIPYDPAIGDGPWWHDEESGTHYSNGKFCLEFMVEHDLELSEVRDVDFVAHHRHQCSIDPRNCPERGLSSHQAASKLLARLAASKVILPDSIRKNRNSRWRENTTAVASVTLGQMARFIEDFEGELTPSAPDSLAVARALLHAYTTPALRDDIPSLARFFRSREDLRECFARLIKELFAP